MQRWCLGVLAMSLVSTVALAEPDGGKSPAGDSGAAMGGDDDDDPPVADAGGKAVAGRRTPAQLELRKTVWERREKSLESKAHKDGKRLTEDERDVIRAHWLRVARLMRIRELAQEDKNDAAVKRADVALEREEKSADAKIEKLNAKAAGGGK